MKVTGVIKDKLKASVCILEQPFVIVVEENNCDLGKLQRTILIIQMQRYEMSVACMLSNFPASDALIVD